MNFRGESVKDAEPADGASENVEQTRNPWNCTPFTSTDTVMVCDPAESVIPFARLAQKVLLQYGHHRRDSVK